MVDYLQQEDGHPMTPAVRELVEAVNSGKKYWYADQTNRCRFCMSKEEHACGCPFGRIESALRAVEDADE